MARARQHRLPATYIGGFGTGKGRARERRLWVRRRGQEATPTTADAVNFERGVYDMSVVPDEASLERMWQLYERRLAPAIDSIVSGRPIPWRYFLKNVVPFIAGLCVRPAMYDKWLEAEHPEAVASHPDFTNLTRAVLMPSLAGRIMRCNWIVVHPQDDARFITNDVGFAGEVTSDDKRFMFVPLRPDAGLQLQRTSNRMWRELPTGRVAVIGRTTVDRDHVHLFNKQTALMAWNEIYGRERGDVDSVPLGRHAAPTPRFAGVLLHDPAEDERNPPDQEWLAELKRANIKASDVVMGDLEDLDDRSEGHPGTPS